MQHTTTISDTADICTLINTFLAKPNNQIGIVESLKRFTLVASQHPGFIAASIHVSVDGDRVVNYAQWKTRETLAAMLKTKAARLHLAEVGALAESITPIFYRVAFVGAGPHASA